MNDQRSLSEQLTDLIKIASQHGLYDAADYLDAARRDADAQRQRADELGAQTAQLLRTAEWRRECYEQERAAHAATRAALAQYERNCGHPQHCRGFMRPEVECACGWRAVHAILAAPPAAALDAVSTQDELDAAKREADAIVRATGWSGADFGAPPDAIAAAVAAERERCAAMVDDLRSFLNAKYEIGHAWLMEELRQIAAKIRSAAPPEGET